MRNSMCERPDLIPGQANCMIFTEDSETEILILSPKEQISEGW